MLNVHEAREIALQHYGRNEELCEVLSCIRTSARSGRFSEDVPKVLHDGAIDALQALGYDVTITEGRTVITWI